jgi:D-alanyl-D-alanine carboxypeptidase/D-alanyl-D-alanine-endopeptidase (penicillin-binding protein 4)
MALLPVGGEDGTLSTRFGGTAGRIRAKTGTMTHVSALAGYVETPSGETLAFSILVNNHTAPNSEIRAIIDRIVVTLIQ